MGLGLRRGLKFALQEALELSAVNLKSCDGELSEGRRSGVLIHKAILHGGFQSLVELAGESFVVPLHKSLDAVEIGEVGPDGGGLVQVTELPFLRSYDVRVPKGVLQGLGILFEGLELGWDLLQGTSRHRSCILIKQGLKPIIHGSVEITGGKENLLRFS